MPKYLHTVANSQITSLPFRVKHTHFKNCIFATPFHQNTGIDNCRFDNCEFTSLNLAQSEMSRTIIQDCSFTGLRARNLRLTRCQIRNTSFAYSDFASSHICRCDFDEVALTHCVVDSIRLESKAPLTGIAITHGFGERREKFERLYRIVTLVPIGPRRCPLVAYLSTEGIWLSADFFFFGSEAEFVERLDRDHPSGIFRQEYLAALEFFKIQRALLIQWNEPS